MEIFAGAPGVKMLCDLTFRPAKSYQGHRSAGPTRIKDQGLQKWKAGEVQSLTLGCYVLTSGQGVPGLHDRLSHWDLRCPALTQLGKSAGRPQACGLQGSDGSIAGLPGIVQGLAHLCEVLDEDRKAVVHLAPEIADPLDILGNLPLAPTVGGREKKADERGGVAMRTWIAGTS